MQETPKKCDDTDTQRGCTEHRLREVHNGVEHLPKEVQRNTASDGVTELVEQRNALLAEMQTQSLGLLADSMSQLAQFVTNGGLVAALNGFAKTQAVKEILGGLAAHEGRRSLDARVLGQNAIEIVEAIEKVHDKYSERLQEKALRDPEIKPVVEEPEIQYLKNGEPVK